jgi:hypothetical protein
VRRGDEELRGGDRADVGLSISSGQAAVTSCSEERGFRTTSSMIAGLLQMVPCRARASALKQATGIIMSRAKLDRSEASELLRIAS